jgi:hypothetical protein
VKVVTQEKGTLEILVVWSEKGLWESEWEPLRGTLWAGLLTIVKPEVMEHALRGWSKPLVMALGLPPSGALRKIPSEFRQCAQRGTCPLYEAKKCQPVATELPWCFEPEGIEDFQVKEAASRLIQVWHEAVYVVVT